MKREQAIAIFGKGVVDKIDLDPTSLAIETEFGRLGGEYRDRAVDLLRKNRISFRSDTNLVHTLMRRYLKAVCPGCGRTMKFGSGGGSSDMWTANAKCECGVTVAVTVPADGFRVVYPEKS